MRDFRTLVAWQRAHKLTLAVYRLTDSFPPEELYGLTSQMKRSAASVPTNISEGCGADGGLEFARFLQMGMRSASELDYQLILARDLEYMTVERYEPFEQDVAEIKRILNSLIHKVRSDVRDTRAHRRRNVRPTANG